MLSYIIVALILVVVVFSVLLITGQLTSLLEWLKKHIPRGNGGNGPGGHKPGGNGGNDPGGHEPGGNGGNDPGGHEPPSTGRDSQPPIYRGNHRENEVGGYSYIQSKKSRGTLILPQIAVEQLDPRGQRVVHTFFVCDIPESGISISRPNATEGEIKLIAYNEIARSVSENHLTIGLDKKGFFWVNKNAEVITVYNKVKTACHNIKDGDTLYLGTGYQPIRIRILTPEIYQDLLSKLERGNSMDDRDSRTQFFNGGAPVGDLRRRFRQMGGEE